MTFGSEMSNPGSPRSEEVTMDDPVVKTEAVTADADLLGSLDDSDIVVLDMSDLQPEGHTLMGIPSSSNASVEKAEPARKPGPRQKCRKCKQNLSKIRLASSPPANAISEVEVVKNPLISVEGSESDHPQAWLHEFSVMDSDGHLVLFSEGLVNAGTKLYFDGVVKPIFGDEQDMPVKGCGPILQWWVTGFNQGENITIGITTALADYHLKLPSAEYKPIMDELTEKIVLSKMVFEIGDLAFEDANDISYEDLLLKLVNMAPTYGLDFFSEEVLLNNARFIVDQIGSFEEGDLEDEDEDEESFKLIHSTGIRKLGQYSGQKMRVEGKKAELQNRSKKRDKSKKHPPRRPGRKSRVPKSNFIKATITPLVRHVFESVFKHQIVKEKKDVLQDDEAFNERCGTCSNCHKQDCGICNACQRMTKYGGGGTRVECIRRICDNLEVAVVSIVDENDPRSAKRGRSETMVEFIGAPIKEDEEMRYYLSARVNQIMLGIGDIVSISPGIEATPLFIARIIYLCEEATDKMAHVQFFCRGQDTVLGMTSDPRELFLIGACEDVLLSEVVQRVDCSFWPVPEDWNAIGGTEDAINPAPISEKEGCFWFRMRYCPEYARFESVSFEEDCFTSEDPESAGLCLCCAQIEGKAARKKPFIKSEPQNGLTDDGMVDELPQLFAFRGIEFSIGDACFVKPEAFEMPDFIVKSKDQTVPKAKQKRDPTKYPEYYRFKGLHVKGSTDLTPEPFRICVIESIHPKHSSGRAFGLRVRKIYRPENTHFGERLSHASDINYVLYSDEIVTIDPIWVMEKCYIRPKALLKVDLSHWYETGKYRFLFDRLYNRQENKLESLSDEVLAKYSNSKKYSDLDGSLPVLEQRLKTLDVFAGCGGLSTGLAQSGLANPMWAIENYAAAADAYQMNHPKCIVINADCNLVLEEVMNGRTCNEKGQAYPLKGQVEMLAAGPPCQGFSHMNIFSEREYSKFKNSLVSTYLSYCDYYRPRFLIFENVMNFALYKRNLVLKLCLRALTLMGYQCTFGILQAGHFGVPQTRRRCIIMAAAPGEVLPLYPEVQHVFTRTGLSVKVDEKIFSSNCQFHSSAPYRTVTVKDAMGDLPPIQNGSDLSDMPYSKPPTSHFQRLVRRSNANLNDHICRNLAPLIEMRISFIPMERGSDWRDLPNIVVTLRDGTTTEKLQYNYGDFTRPHDAALKGVCSCNGKKNAPCHGLQQKMTLIPWCLPHTANRNGNWSGLYGRIDWDGYFSTTVTNPEPISKQGRVLHPNQHRVVSVRECARSQGFDDGYRFKGSIMEKHRQIGNAVPPPMAKAIGKEIIQAMAQMAIKTEMEFTDNL
eukprot:maker-scaffold145_size311916-snap-gene-0.17 protein:Tk09171 transcript:maker-scaffold145_size311916-snap-gene-0.17-mRNA-1 annotation:"dna (cytosine-5)-methyltransferase -like"